MTDDREFWRATTDWLETGSDRTPPHAVDAVLLAVRSTRQERPLPVPWRSFPMQTYLRVAIAAAAVVAASVAWLNFTPRDNVGDVVAPSGTVVPTPSSTPTSTPNPSPTPRPLPVPTGDSGLPLQAGARYVVTDPFPFPMSIVAPPGWSGHIGGPNAVWLGPLDGDDVVSFQRFDKVFTDPCHPEPGGMVPSIGPAASDLVNAIVTRPGLAPTTPTSTTLGGRPATELRLMLGAPQSDCTNGTYQLWELPLGATNQLQTGMSERAWVMDVDGQRLVVLAIDAGDASQVQQDAIQQVIDSIRFEAGPEASPAASASP